MSRPLGRGAEGVLAARTRLIKLVLPKGIDGDLAMRISDAIEMLERAAYRAGDRGELEPWPAYVPVTAAELANVKAALAEWDAELSSRRVR